jgi:LuxR family transcriptional regulator, maltose regulon positive regulatory protein
VRFHDLGDPRLVVNGELVRPQIAKSLDVLAFLARAPDHRVDREALLAAVFDSRSDHSSRTYLRQAVQKLRDLMPDGADVVVERHEVAIVGASVATDSARFERMLDEAGRLDDSERIAALEAALELYETGEFLAGRDTAWSQERRSALAARAADARFDAAELHFAANDLGSAQGHLDAALAADPYRERAWRLGMRIASARGDQDRVAAVFRRCELALAEIGIAPSPSTRRLLDGLRS